MNALSEVAVTLAPELLDRLRSEAAGLGLSLEWLIASLIVDSLDEADLPAAVN
ncbi:hypothetical protein ACYOEI_14140 [Singulisphaera rosea]